MHDGSIIAMCRTYTNKLRLFILYKAAVLLSFSHDYQFFLHLSYILCGFNHVQYVIFFSNIMHIPCIKKLK